MKKFIALLTSWIPRRRVFTGIGSSVDGSLQINEEAYEKHRQRLDDQVAFRVTYINYVAKDPSLSGDFRLVNLARKVQGQVHFQVKHMPTGKLYNIDKDLFHILFERK